MSVIEKVILAQIGRVIASPISTQPAPPAGATLAFHALYYNDSYEMEDVLVGTGPAVFTHASDIFRLDHEDIYREAGANENVLSDGRVVEGISPLFSYSLGSVAVTEVETDVFEVSGLTTSFNDRMITEFAAIINKDIVVGYSIKALNVSDIGKNISSRLIAAAPGVTPSAFTQTLTAEYVVSSSPVATNSTSNSNLYLYGTAANNADGFVVKLIRQENVEGQPNQVPSEFVIGTSVYANANGNTMDGNGIVTEAVGAPLASVPFSNYVPDATNEALDSNNITTANWPENAGGQDHTIKTFDRVGLDGSLNSATLLTDNEAGTSCLQRQVISVERALNTIVFWLLKDTDETVFPEFHWRMASTLTGDGIALQVNKNNGAAVARINTDSATWEIIDGGLWWKICIEQAYTNGVAQNTIGVGAAVSTTLGGALVSSATGSVSIGQDEIHKNKTIAEVRNLPPIFTTTAAVSTTAVDPISFPIANHSDTSGLYYFEWNPSYSTAEATGNQIILTLNGLAGLVYYDPAAGAIKSTDGTNTVSVAKTIVAGTVYKIALTYSGVVMQISCDDTDGAVGVYSGSFPQTGDLEFAAGGTYAQGIRDFRRYDIDSQSDGYIQRDLLLP